MTDLQRVGVTVERLPLEGPQSLAEALEYYKREEGLTDAQVDAMQLRDSDFELVRVHVRPYVVLTSNDIVRAPVGWKITSPAEGSLARRDFTTSEQERLRAGLRRRYFTPPADEEMVDDLIEELAERGLALTAEEFSERLGEIELIDGLRVPRHRN